MRLVDARDAMRPPGSPRRGGSGRLNIQPRGSAPRERDHGGGDHPVPFRTRQLSPPSPRVLRSSPWEARESRSRRALVLCARGTARGRREARRGDRPLRASSRFAAAAGMRPRPRMHDASGAFLRLGGRSVPGAVRPPGAGLSELIEGGGCSL